MTPQKAVWKVNEGFPVGKGATIQQYLATVGDNKLEMNVSPWGEGDLKVNGVEIAHLKDRKDRRQVFAELKKVAERHMQRRMESGRSK